MTIGSHGAGHFVLDASNTARLGRDFPVAEALALVGEVDDLCASGDHVLVELARMRVEDELTYAHSLAVCGLMIKFARCLDMAEAEVRDCGWAGLLHDIGKMRLPAAVLHKHGPVTPDEYEAIKAHAEHGYLMLQGIAGIPLRALELARLHHERMDGSGYPLGLIGDEIPLIARMGMICDVYDALTSPRAYKVAWSPGDAIAKMFASTGHFDIGLLQAFTRCLALPNLPSAG